MAVLLTQSWNEARLLPLWLEHHCKLFDRVIVIDFASDDGTRDIVKLYGAELLESNMVDFQADAIDRRVEEIEATIEGPRISLNVTEFFLGDPKSITRELFIPSVSLINMPNDPDFDWSRQFFEQRRWGISFERDFMRRRSRRFSFEAKPYPLGRHFMLIDREDFVVVHVADCFVDATMFARRLAIQDRIPQRDKDMMLGYQHHNWNRGLTRDDLLEQQNRDRASAQDLSEYLP